MSGNTRRTITIEKKDSKEGRGVPGYKLNFTTPQGTDNHISEELDQLRKTMNILVIDLLNGGMPWSYYNTQARNPDWTSALFSQTGGLEPSLDMGRKRPSE